MGVFGWKATFFGLGEVLSCFGDEETSGPVPSLTVVQGMREVFDLLVSMNNGSLQGPGKTVCG